MTRSTIFSSETGKWNFILASILGNLRLQVTGTFAFDPFKDRCCVIHIPADVGFSRKDQIMFGKARL